MLASTNFSRKKHHYYIQHEALFQQREKDELFCIFVGVCHKDELFLSLSIVLFIAINLCHVAGYRLGITIEYDLNIVKYIYLTLLNVFVWARLTYLFPSLPMLYNLIIFMKEYYFIIIFILLSIITLFYCLK